ncbi:MAG TPA: hypothetical protein VKU02_32400 [Gemmataceae bacterium]|nr:hypothetical protein [Gemmataceae bacterium]
MRNQNRTRKFRRPLFIERLEDRALLSGNITATSNNGVLSILGDTGNNDVEISQSGPAIVVASMTSTINGQSNPVSFTNVNSIQVQFLDGVDSVSINGIHIPGALSVTEGTGPDTLMVVNSTFQQLDSTIGREFNPAVTAPKFDVNSTVSNDVITGDHVNLSILNGSGVSGRSLIGLPVSGLGSLINVAMSGLTFSGGGKLNVRADDGIPYFNPATHMLTPASSALLNFIRTTGSTRVVLGDHFQNVQSDFGQLGSLALSVGNDADVVDVSENVIQGSETVIVGNDAPYPTSLLPPPFVTVNGQVGVGPSGGDLHVQVGSNINPTVPMWDVQVVSSPNEGPNAPGAMIIHGSLQIMAGNGDAVTVDPTSDDGPLDIAMGDGGINSLESLTMLDVDSNDPYITFNSKRGDTVNINLTNVRVHDANAYFFMRDFGHGTDVVNLSNVQVAGLFTVLLSDSGDNVVTAQNVHVLRGYIFGGGRFGNRYINLGGNSGYSVIGFIPG